MYIISRRSFIGATAAVPFAAWLERTQGADKTYTRPEARSSDGKAMLKLYQTGVGNMMKTAETDPTSWVFQWYTHFVKASTTKDNELNRIYSSDPKYKPLAQDMWDTCQAHQDDEDENFFLPWHRMFVYYFERIVRKACGNPDFALPYWNYSVDGTDHGVIPPEFTKAGSSLYVKKRNPGVNSGQPIDKRSPGALNLDVLSEPAYEGSGEDPGFCANLDGNLHGAVHVLVGNQLNMGQIPWAADDPVFWMHHCNIDRIWASWNKNGGKNQVQDQSTFDNKQFVFADENNTKVTGTVKDFLDLAPLNYTYAEFEPAPPDFSAQNNTLLASAPPVAAGQAEQVALGTKPVTVALKAPQGLTAPPPISSARKLYLVFKNLQTNLQPGVLYGVYLSPPSAGGSGQVSPENRVGTVNFFNAMHHGGAGAEKKKVAVNVTAVAQKLMASGATPAVTIVPDGQPEAQAKPILGQITLVQR